MMPVIYYENICEKKKKKKKKTSVISNVISLPNNKLTNSVKSYCDLLLTFLIEGHAKFKVEMSENEGEISLSKFMDS